MNREEMIKLMKVRSENCPKTTQELVEYSDEIDSEMTKLKERERELMGDMTYIQGLIIYRLLFEEGDIDG